MDKYITGGINFGPQDRYTSYDFLQDVKADLKSKKYLTYNEIIHDLQNGILDTLNHKFRVVNSDDGKIYKYRFGYLCSDDQEHKKLADLYKNCDINNIKLEIIDIPIQSSTSSTIQTEQTNINANKDKYVTIDEFLSSNDEDDEYFTHDSTPRGVAYDRAKKEIIKMLEEKYIDLDMEMDCCQGCMSNLNQAFEELNIYSELVKFLGGDIEGHRQELVDDWYKRAQEAEKKEEEEQAKRDEIIKKLGTPIMRWYDLQYCDQSKSAKIITDTFMELYGKLNEICEIIINMKK